MKEHRENLGSFTGVYEQTEDGRWIVDVPEVAGARTQGETLEETREMIRDSVRELSGSAGKVAERDPSIGNALRALTRAWSPFADECRVVLGSELHYQAMLYHCLRVHGEVPLGQVGMNVKMWITDVVSEHFRALDEKKHPEFQGGFEPIPDIVIFRPEIRGDFRRRNRENTLRQMIVAIEVKASERYRSRLTAGEVIKDIVKLEALRIEARHRGSDILPVVVTIDTAPEASEQMRIGARRETEAAARERGVCSFYVSPSNVSIILPEIL